MVPGQVAIFAERAGQDVCWHPDCFSCWECGEVLEDLLYYYTHGNLYCGRHFASKMKIPRCEACDELIFSTEYTAAEGKFWHVKHFCCWVCDLPLAGHQYIPVQGMPHCLQCWQSLHGKTCFTCHSLIEPRDQRVSLGDRSWHARPDCFSCWMCGSSLLGGKVCVRENKPLCSSDCAQKLLMITATNSYSTTV